MFCFLADTGAMAVLALTCVKNKTRRQKQIDKKDIENINNYTESLINKILSQKTENGLLGNIYSTGEAMQVSQRVKQETEKRVMKERNICILSSWPQKILSTLFPIRTDLM